MRSAPVKWLRGEAELGSLQLKSLLGRRVSEKKGLALEAAFTAEAWLQDPKGVRGGPYCLSRLDGELTSELRAVAEAVADEDFLHAKATAVQRVARQLGAGSAIAKHLRNECFRCGEHFRKCACRNKRRTSADVPSQQRPSRSRSGPSLSGAQKRKGLKRSPEKTVLKWGPAPAKARREDSRLQNLRRPSRSMKVKK